MDQQQSVILPEFERARAVALARADTLGLTGDLRTGFVGGYALALLDFLADRHGTREAVGWLDAAHG